MMLPKDLTKDIKTRLKSIEGQIAGLIKMLESEEDPEKILVQFKAAQKGLDKAHFLMMDEVYRKILAIKIVEAVDACPGNCGNEDRIEFIRRQFPKLELNDLSEKIKEINELKRRIEGFKSDD